MYVCLQLMQSNIYIPIYIYVNNTMISYQENIRFVFKYVITYIL